MTSLGRRSSLIDKKEEAAIFPDVVVHGPLKIYLNSTYVHRYHSNEDLELTLGVSLRFPF